MVYDVLSVCMLDVVMVCVNKIIPRASICMAVYNGEVYLREQLESIASQMTDCDEIVIVDDGSDDRTVEIIRNFDLKNLTLILNKSNEGPCKSFELAIKHARGKYIFLSDQDDVWLKNRIDLYLDCFERNKLDVVVGNALSFDGDANFEKFSFFEQKLMPKSNIFSNILKPRFVGAHMAFHSKLKDTLLPFPRSVYMHDMWIGIYAAINGFSALDDVLTYYRRHENVFTKRKNPIYMKIYWRAMYIYSIGVIFYRKWTR